VPELGLDYAGKVAVQIFVSQNEFIGKRQTGHESAHLEPENGAKAPRKEDSFHDAKGYAAFGKGGVFGMAPLQCSVGLARDTGDGIDGVQQSRVLLRVLNVRVDQQPDFRFPSGCFRRQFEIRRSSS
jgi:hypothetical protein